MDRKFTNTQLIAAATLTLCASIASADDNSMSVLTGESYAYFNHLDYSAGKFNVARAPLPNGVGSAMQAQARDRDTMKMLQVPPAADKPMLAARPPIAFPSPFRDDTGA